MSLISKKKSQSSKGARKKRFGFLKAVASAISVPLLALGFPQSSDALDAVSYTSAGTTYTQTFNTSDGGLQSPAANVAPASGGVGAASSMVELNDSTALGAQAGGVGMTGWYVGNSATANVVKFGTDAGGSNTGSAFNYGLVGNNDRALGGEASGSTQPYFGVILQNNTALTLNNVTIGFTGLEYRNPSSTVNTDTFSYLLTNSSTDNFYTNGYTANTALNFSSAASGSTGGPGAQAAQNPPENLGTKSLNLGASTAWAPGQYLILRWSDLDESGSDAGLAIDNFTFSAIQAANPPQNLTWNALNGTWNHASVNWTGGTTNIFNDGDTANFTDANVGSVTIEAAGVSPAATNVSNTTGTYTFSGGPINGNGVLAKTGNGILDLTGQSGGNGYAGGTTINGGTVKINADNQLGTGGITLGGGTLVTSSSISSTKTIALTGATSNKFDTGGFSSAFGAISGGGDLTVTGNGGLTTNGIYTQTTGALTVDSGTTFTLGANGSSTITGATINGALALSANLRLNFNTGTTSGTGQAQVLSSGTLISNTSGVAGGTVNVNIALNSNLIPFTKGDVTQATYAPGTFVTTIGGTKLTNAGDNTLTIGGVISGDSDVNFANNSTTGGGSGHTLLNAVELYTGTTTVNGNGANVIIGIDNALPTGTDVIFGTQTGIGSPNIDLHGHVLAIGSLSSGANGSGYGVTNTGAADSTLTVGGSTTPANAFTGILSDGATNKLGLIKNGSSTLTLTGVNSYSGATAVNGGALIVGVAGVGSAAKSDITVTNNGMLGGSGTVKSVTINSGGTLSPGNSPGTMTTTAAAFMGGGIYKLEMNQATNPTAGTNNDLLAVNGTLDLSSLSSGTPFVLKLQTLDGSNNPAALSDFNPASNYTWTFATANSITNPAGVFNSNLFSVDPSGFANNYNGTFNVSEAGNALQLQYQAIPESQTGATFVGGAALLLVWRRRRSRLARLGA